MTFDLIPLRFNSLFAFSNLGNPNMKPDPQAQGIRTKYTLNCQDGLIVVFISSFSVSLNTIIL